MDIFIAVLIVMAVMIYFMAVTLRAITGNANRRVNQYFLRKLEDYSDEFKEMTDDIERLAGEKGGLEREINVMKRDMISFKTSPFYAPRPLARSIYIPVARYINDAFFEEYKAAKDMLKMNKEDIVQNIIDVVPYTGNMTKYEAATSVIKKLNFQALYDLSALSGKAQYDVLDECLEGEEHVLFEEYVKEWVKDEKLDALDFVNRVKEIQKVFDPQVYVRTGELEEDFSHVKGDIVWDFDPNVCEGIKIIYQNRIYDYSIYKSRRKITNSR